MNSNYSKQVENILNEILIEMGFYDEQPDIQDDLLKQMDSLQFIQFVIALESKLEIGVPDEFLLFEYFNTKNAISDTLEKILSSVQSVPETNADYISSKERSE